MYPPYYNKSVGYPPPPQINNWGTDPARDLENNQQEGLNWEWYSPSEDSLPVNFCLDTSLHGLQYLGQQRRHCCERLVWLAAVIAAIGTAGYLIWGMYTGNRDMPIITVFRPTEKTIDEIPFPAVTICSVNNIQKSKFDTAVKAASMAVFMKKEEANRLYAKILDMYYICDSAATFTDKFERNGKLGIMGDALRYALFNNTHDFEKFVDPSKTLAENSQSCKDMIMFCVWLGEIEDCSKLFRKVETDFGYCCTFNLIPISLLLRNRNDPQDDPERVAEWSKENLDYDNLLFTEKTKDTRKQPFRQLYPGREAGLSIFLDPDLDEYHCTNTDSLGFVVGLDVPLDYPRIRDNGISVPNGSEVLISIRPQITMTDRSVENFSVEKRRCYFGNEFKLPHYTKYTTANCLDECIANQTRRECGCLRYYMPHDETDKLCRPTDFSCVEAVQKTIYQEGLGKACGVCLPTCTEIEYDAMSTQLMVQDTKVEKLFNRSLLDLIGKHIFKKNDHHHPSIVHIYFGVDSTYPRLRTESASMTQLISNAGGILGLCLGFSVLSLLEIAYYVTIRLGCNWYRERSLEKNKVRSLLLQYDNGAQMKMLMSKGGGWTPGHIQNPGFPVNNIQASQTRYNNVFQKWNGQ